MKTRLVKFEHEIKLNKRWEFIEETLLVEIRDDENFLDAVSRINKSDRYKKVQNFEDKTLYL